MPHGKEEDCAKANSQHEVVNDERHFLIKEAIDARTAKVNSQEAFHDGGPADFTADVGILGEGIR